MLVDFLVANTTREEGRNIAITARGGGLQDRIK